MKSIQNEIINEITINKSIFINYLVNVSSVDDANQILSDLRKKYPDANHHCFSYIIGNNQEIQKYSDDGEPSKTAGMPMLEVLKKHELTNVLNVSIRYFGGIKLGAGGLVRAYTKSCSEAVKQATFSHLTSFTTCEVVVSFNEIGRVEKFIRDHYHLLDTTYDQQVHYFIKMESSLLDDFIKSITEFTNGNGTVNTIDTSLEYK